MISFCQILAVIVLLNVLFNKKWHKAYIKRKEREMQNPLWFRLLIVFSCISFVFILSLYAKYSNKSKDAKQQSYSQIP